MNIILTRNAITKPNWVWGQYDLTFDSGKTITVRTLENRDFIIPEGTYPLKSTWSPRFKKFLPEICDVPERTGIRIHMGNRPEHSQGCILVNAHDLANTQAFINQQKIFYEDEPLNITIVNECQL
jgi:hypothetical protein